MKKGIFLKGAILVLILCFPFLGNAQRLLTENFEYADGNLIGQGNWVQTGTVSSFPLQVTSTAQLNYEGYQNPAVGKSVYLDNSGQDALKTFTAKSSGEIYASILVNFSAVQSTNNQGEYFFHFGESETSTYYAGRVMVKQSPDGEKMIFGISRAGTSTLTEWDTNEYELNKTHLIVLKYEFVDGEKNDIASLFINPVISSTEPQPNSVSKDVSGADLSQAGAIGIRQGTGSRTPLGHVGALRVAETWADLFDLDTPPNTDPEIILSGALTFGNVYEGGSYMKTINVKGSNLKGDISISGLNENEMTASATTITKEQAEAEGGFDIIFSLKPVSEFYTGDILFDSEDAVQKKISTIWVTSPVVTATSISDLRLQYDSIDTGKTFRVTGEVVITDIFINGSTRNIYIQDENSSITINDALGKLSDTYKVGDKLKNIVGNYKISAGTSTFESVGGEGELVSEGNVVEPTVVTLAELQANPLAYEARLIKVENVLFSNRENENDGYFSDLSYPANRNKITQNEITIDLWVRNGMDFVGNEIPEYADVIGIVTNANGNLIAPRSAEDITPNTDPFLIVNPETVSRLTTTVGTPVNFPALTLTYGNLPNPLDIDLRGTGASHFSYTIDTINNNTQKINITYNPTTAGNNHSAILAIDCPGAEFLYTSISLQGTATDPVNIPNISVNVSDPLTFTAEVGKQSIQQVLISSENITDYLYAKVTGETQGSFILSNTLLVKNKADVPLDITFAPKSSGTFTSTIEIYSQGAESVFIEVSGTATGSITDPDKEGDEYPLDPSNPLVLLNEKFDDIVHNKPLIINGWKNIAEVNYRAWWGYDFNGQKGINEFAAKATAYNSLNPAEVPYEMWLITPPLDFKNAASKMFTFRVMGELMIENSDAVLELYYMDMDGEELYKDKIEVPMPSDPDQNNEWLEFHMNLEGQNIADIFFMGFRFAATGGSANSVTYYIDDVSFGRTDLPVISPSVSEITGEAQPDVETYLETINVSANNLTEPITISIMGANPGNFDTSEETLPAEGGEFYINFLSEQQGIHEAYIKLSSRGAADVYIPMAVLCKTSSGIGSNNKVNNVWTKSNQIHISTADESYVSVYNLTGYKLKDYTIQKGTIVLPDTFENGIYILQIRQNKETINYKIIIE